MKHISLLLLAVCLVAAGCTTTSNNKDVQGVITKKEHDRELTRRYILGTSGVSDIKNPDVKWLRIKGENRSWIMAIDQTDAKALAAWHLLEVGDVWPQK